MSNGIQSSDEAQHQSVNSQQQWLKAIKTINWLYFTPKKLIGLFLVLIGYLLSPLCWWNDLVFNLPLAYGFGYLCSWIWSDLLLPASIVGYWISNVIGILLMQFGAINVIQKQPQEINLKKELMSGFLSSTAYTVVILLLMQLKILDTPQL